MVVVGGGWKGNGGVGVGLMGGWKGGRGADLKIFGQSNW